MASIIAFLYFIVAILFIYGLKQMSSPRTARDGIVIAGIGMLLATIATLFAPQIQGFNNYFLIVVAIAIGSVIAYYSGKKVAMTNMPQMIAIYNGMGGGAAAAIAAVELLHQSKISFMVILLALLGAIIGTISFSGSIIAYAKLEGLIKRVFNFPQQQMANGIVALCCIMLALLLLFFSNSSFLLSCFFLILFLLGISITLPIGGANMPVIISLFNAMTGLAVALEGFVLNNEAMIIAGTVVGASGSLLTQLMAKAMNQSIKSILFSAYNPQQYAVAEESTHGSLKPIEPTDAAIMLVYSKQVIIVPGYGMAVAQAQHKIHELADLLHKHDVKVKYAIHPVAGRMPGHMNVLLAEAGVPYDQIYDLEEINAEFPQTDVVIVIGANDVVNPAARTNPNSPIHGMPILNADQAKNVLVIKRGQGKGFSGIENDLFYMDHTRMLYGDGQAVANQLIQAIKSI